MNEIYSGILTHKEFYEFVEEFFIYIPRKLVNRYTYLALEPYLLDKENSNDLRRI